MTKRTSRRYVVYLTVGQREALIESAAFMLATATGDMHNSNIKALQNALEVLQQAQPETKK